MNDQTLGIILGVIFTIVVMVITVTLVLFYIYNSQPEFLCDLCKNDCDLQINYPSSNPNSLNINPNYLRLDNSN